LIGIADSAVKAGDEALAVGSGLVEPDGVGSGAADSLTDGSKVFVTEGLGTLRSGSEVSVQPKKLERIKTVPKTPTSRLALLSDFKLNCLNGAI
jgi:hypothetical protein